MSFKKFLLLLALPLAFALGSCTPEMNTDGIIPACAIVDAEGNPISRIDIPAEGGDMSLNVTANRAWNAAITADWFAVNPSSVSNPTHESVTTVVTVTAFPNTSGQARQSTVAITAEGLPAIELTVNQLAEGQVATGKVIYYDNFDKGTAVDNSGWPALDDFVNPTGEAAEGATYSIANVQARSNSQSNNSHSGYKDEASGGNNAFFRTSGVLTINNLNLAGQDSKDYTLSFGCYRSVFGDTDNSFKASEFHVYVSGDGEKWTELVYTRPADEVSSYGTWNLATATFTLKEKPSTLSICFVSDLASSHRLDDVKLNIGGGGAEIDLSQGTAIGSGDTGGDTGSEVTPIEPGETIKATIAEFIASSESDTQWYELTGTITSIERASTGNIYIKDETGTILIYGLCATPVSKNDNSFESLGLKVNDIVTLATLRTSYNDVAQGGGTPPAYYISHVEGEEYTGPEVPDGATLVTMVSKDLGLANQTNVNGKTYNLDDNISVTFNKGNSSTPPAYYENGEAIRLYQNGATMDVTAANGKSILTIEFTFSSNQCYMSADCGSLSEENAIRTWTGESSAVKFTSTGTDKDHRVYIKEMKVIYK